MKRDIEDDLLKWKLNPSRMPLLLRGARQVGKTYIIEKFGAEQFDTLVSINLEQQPEFHTAFNSLEPQKIISVLEVLSGKKITPGKTLLFLDEIQDCPQAIMALRYFKEQMPELSIMGAGSLLELVLNDHNFRMPVGRVEFLYLKPLSFMEFLDAMDASLVRHSITTASLSNPIPDAIHHHLLKLMKEYSILGGMPAVLQKYLETRSFLDCQHIQSALLQSYRQDFGKYATKAEYKNLQMLFEKAPGLIAQWFKYSKVNPDVAPKDIRQALTHLSNMGIIDSVYATAASGLPLITTRNEKKFKLLFLDVGLVKRACQLDSDMLLQNDLFLLNQGALAEQLVGQELLAYGDKHTPPALHFWVREQKNSSAEVDYLVVIDGHIIPLEVKSGTTGKMKSLKIFLEEKKNKLGLQVSQQPLAIKNNILTVPIYLLGELTRLVREYSKKTAN